MRLTLALLLVAALPAVVHAQQTPVLIRGAAVFDGERKLGVRDVLLRDGRIARIAKRIDASGATVVEGSGKTLLPGLIDSHVHVFPSAAADALRFGVTTEFDMFTLGAPGDAGRRKAQRESYAATGEADVWSAGVGVTPPGGHPAPMAKRMGVEIPTLGPDGDVRAFIAARIGEGSDHIKIFQDDGTANGAPASLTAFPRDRLAVVIREAKAAGRKAIVHVSKLSDARDAFAFGADALAHVWEDQIADDMVVELAAKRQAAVIPTLSVLASLSGEPMAAALSNDTAIKPHLSATQTGMLAAKFPKPVPGAIEKALQSVGRLHKGGVTILAGTDASNPGTAHGPSIHGELQLLVRAGLTPIEALKAGTAAPARFFGASDRGRIAQGLRADLVLVEGDPTRDIGDTRRIAAIWKNGYLVDRANIPAPRLPASPAPPPSSPANARSSP
jgi:imidazolonepropionase-like amidohydrolase